jgi:hypothetical protein
LAPSQVKIINDEAIILNLSFKFGLNFDEEEDFFFNSSENKIKILIIKARTPPSLLGIARKIA